MQISKQNSHSWRQGLPRLRGKGDIAAAHQNRSRFFDQLPGIVFDHRHRRWFEEWVSRFTGRNSANFWLTLAPEHLQATWDKYVEDRRQKLKDARKPPLPVKDVRVPRNTRLEVSKRYIKPGWV